MEKSLHEKTKRKIFLALILWLITGWWIGGHRLYLKEDLWWLYLLLFVVSIAGMGLGPGSFTLIALIIFWLYDGFRLTKALLR
jgi:hypothetical protein